MLVHNTEVEIFRSQKLKANLPILLRRFQVSKRDPASTIKTDVCLSCGFLKAYTPACMHTRAGAHTHTHTSETRVTIIILTQIYGFFPQNSSDHN